MIKDKYDFILDLIENKKLNSFQKERVLRLSVLEVKKEGDNKNTELIKRIEEIEKKLNGEIISSGQNEEEHNKQVKRHKPKETYELLSYFSSTDGGMKNLTHSFNFGFIAYEALMKKCKEEFEQGRKKYPDVPEALLKRIEEFTFSESPDWYIMRGDEKIQKKIGWAEPTFVKWYKENQTHPANDAYYNSEMIVPFKETIQVRSDIGNLIKLINELSDKVFQNETKPIIKEAIHTAQFYTDVDRLGLAIYHIFTAIKQASSKNFCDQVEIDFEIQDGVKIIKIVHIDSKPTKSVNDFDFLGGDLGTVKSNLWSLCNYDILAKFQQGEYRKVILSDKPGEIEKNKETGKWMGKNYPITGDKIKGFTHLLKFY
jgi:hypothetical protein